MGLGNSNGPSHSISNETKQILEVGKARWSFLNCQGIRKKMENLKGLLHREKFGIMVLAETWLMQNRMWR